MKDRPSNSAGALIFGIETISASPSALGRVPGIDRHHCAGDVPGLVAEQEFYRICDVVDLGKMVECAASCNLLTLLTTQTDGHLGVQKTGCDCVDVDAEWAKLPRERSCKTDDRRF